MSHVRVDQTDYKMPPLDGFTLTHFLTVPTSNGRFDFTKGSSEVAF
jgi:hypothetical protein